jgi:hypothetical protein
MIAAWLGTTKYSKISIHHDSIWITIKYTYRTPIDRNIGIIGESWVVIHPGNVIEAADPEFFSKLEYAIKNAAQYNVGI